MEIKNENGKLKTQDELFNEALETLIDKLDSYLCDYELLALTNEIREFEGYDPLYENNENELNDALENEDPYNILRMASDRDWQEYDEYFMYDGYGSIETTDDAWYNLDEEDVARALLEGGYASVDLPSVIQEVLDEYEEAKERLEDYNPNRAMCEDVIAKYVNCQADVTDLLQVLDRLARSEEVWARE